MLPNHLWQEDDATVVHPPFDPIGAESTGMDPLSAEALYAFKRSMMLHRRLLASVLGGEETLHPAQAGCVRALAYHDGLGQSELADALHVSRPTVTTMLQRMEATGTIERRPDEADSRITRVYLTEEGRRLADRMHAAFGEIASMSVGRLSDDDRREFVRILEALNTHVTDALTERGVSTFVHPHGHGGADAR